MAKAEDILAICIKLKLPSCIRAPPEAHTIITGRDLLVAYSIKRVIFSPTTDPTVEDGSVEYLKRRTSTNQYVNKRGDNYCPVTPDERVGIRGAIRREENNLRGENKPRNYITQRGFIDFVEMNEKRAAGLLEKEEKNDRRKSAGLRHGYTTGKRRRRRRVYRASVESVPSREREMVFYVQYD